MIDDDEGGLKEKPEDIRHPMHREAHYNTNASKIGVIYCNVIRETDERGRQTS